MFPHKAVKQFTFYRLPVLRALDKVTKDVAKAPRWGFDRAGMQISTSMRNAVHLQRGNEFIQSAREVQMG
jgi:hypothetical protein